MGVTAASQNTAARDDSRRSMWLHVAVAAAVSALHAVVVLGQVHPDEVFQALEPAVHALYGYGVSTWEWSPASGGGVRNWALPGLVMAALKASDAVGLSHPLARRAVVGLPLWLLHAAMLAAVFRFSARRVGPTLGLACVWLVALYPPIIWFGGRTLSEGVSTPFLVIALVALEAKAPRGWVPLSAGVLMGLGEVMRYASAPIAVAAVAWLFWQRRFRDAGLVLVGGAVVAAALWALDEATWGFSSMWRYFSYNISSGQAAGRFGEHPWYQHILWLVFAPATVLVLLRQKARSQVSTLMVSAAVTYVAVLMAVAHKERRFLYPAFVLLAVATAPLFVAWVSQQRVAGRRRVALGLVGAVVAANLALFVLPCPLAPREGALFRLTVAAGRQAHGLLIVGRQWEYTAGAFYLGRAVPTCIAPTVAQECFSVALMSQTYDRAVTVGAAGRTELERAGFVELQRDGEAALFGRR